MGVYNIVNNIVNITMTNNTDKGEAIIVFLRSGQLTFAVCGK